MLPTSRQKLSKLHTLAIFRLFFLARVSYLLNNFKGKFSNSYLADKKLNHILENTPLGYLRKWKLEIHIRKNIFIIQYKNVWLHINIQFVEVNIYFNATFSHDLKVHGIAECHSVCYFCVSTYQTKIFGTSKYVLAFPHSDAFYIYLLHIFILCIFIIRIKFLYI